MVMVRMDCIWSQKVPVTVQYCLDMALASLTRHQSWSLSVQYSTTHTYISHLHNIARLADPRTAHGRKDYSYITMNSSIAPRTAPVCNLCRHLSRGPAKAPTRTLHPFASQQRWSCRLAEKKDGAIRYRTRRPRVDSLPSHQARRSVVTAAVAQADEQSIAAQDLTSANSRVQQLSSQVLGDTGIPTEDVVLQALEAYQSIAQKLLGEKTPTSKSTKAPSENTATSALLSSVKTQPTSSTVTRALLLSNISDRAQEIIEHEPVFISASILKTYISLQSLLGRPQSFPAVFDMYRYKPVPRPTSASKITYTRPNADKPAAAIPPAIADMAVDAAIAVRHLPLALATIDASYCTTAYKRSKFLRSALFPLAGLVLTPPAAYTLATRFSDLQTTMDPATATQIAMAGILTYTTAVATVGYVALTTANDQMVRATWATGVPLWERWVREEERGAVDKLAQAWGFKSMDRRGEEDSDEWTLLKEWAGVRAVVIDRTELMPGME